MNLYYMVDAILFQMSVQNLKIWLAFVLNNVVTMKTALQMLFVVLTDVDTSVFQDKLHVSNLALCHYRLHNTGC